MLVLSLGVLPRTVRVIRMAYCVAVYYFPRFVVGEKGWLPASFFPDFRETTRSSSKLAIGAITITCTTLGTVTVTVTRSNQTKSSCPCSQWYTNYLYYYRLIFINVLTAPSPPLPWSGGCSCFSIKTAICWMQQVAPVAQRYLRREFDPGKRDFSL